MLLKHQFPRTVWFSALLLLRYKFVLNRHAYTKALSLDLLKPDWNVFLLKDILEQARFEKYESRKHEQTNITALQEAMSYSISKWLILYQKS